jgi:hypothetical protein
MVPRSALGQISAMSYCEPKCEPVRTGAVFAGNARLIHSGIK